MGNKIIVEYSIINEEEEEEAKEFRTRKKKYLNCDLNGWWVILIS